MVHYEQLPEDQQERARKNTFVTPTMTLDDWPAVRGYDFNKGFEPRAFFKALTTTGFQATELGKAISIVKEMRREQATVFFGFTSNMASCGVRDIIAWLCKEKMIDVLVTTIGGVEEDLIKCLKPFVIGNYDAPGKMLRERGINRTGNLFIPNDRYLHYERFINPFLERINEEYTKRGNIITTRQLCYELGREAEKLERKEESIYYWCSKNDIPVFCPAPTDGSTGDLIVFFKQQHPEFKIDLTDDIVDITRIALNAEKTGIIAIGGSVPKHHIANANLFREGADYAVYLTTATEHEGSNAGANIEEAISWGKVKDDARRAKVVGDASITFPLLIAGALMEDEERAGEEKKTL
jgi:deoxyhypusine synthase